MSADKLFNIVSGAEYQLNILKDAIKVLDKEEQEKVDEAYQRGYKDCETRYCSFDACPNRQAEYQRGLEDAWDTVKKMYLDCECRKITGEYFNNYIKNHTINDAIKLFKDYEEKQYKIAVGDEVIYNGTTKCIVVRPEDDERYASLIDGDGTHYSADHRECKKTGRHFDIASILEDMRND